MKSTVEEIRQRFDADVERFSNLETGQSATVDAPLAMALVAEAAAATTPHARHVLDVGCGAGNYTLRLLERLPSLDATLIEPASQGKSRAARLAGSCENVSSFRIAIQKFPEGFSLRHRMDH
jgi:tRNA (cmo5U34)-methyltransferase